MDALVKFLVEEKTFEEDRVRKAVERLWQPSRSLPKVPHALHMVQCFCAKDSREPKWQPSCFLGVRTVGVIFGPVSMKSSTQKRKEPEVKAKGKQPAKKGNLGGIGGGKKK